MKTNTLLRNLFSLLIILSLLTPLMGCAAPPTNEPAAVPPSGGEDKPTSPPSEPTAVDEPGEQPPLQTDTAGVKVLQSPVQRDLAPDVSAAEMEEWRTGNSAFAFDLYQALRAETDGNLFYSPYSISTALAMTYAGAAANTEAQMAQTIHFTLPQERLHPAFNSLDLALSSRGEDAGEDSGAEDQPQPFQLEIANSLWGQEDYTFLAPFLDTLAMNYGAGLRLVDFASDPQGSRQKINDWVSAQTNERIKDLIPPGGIDSLTRLVLANAIYFKADWLHQFDKNLTVDAPFTLLDGSQVTVSMMGYGRPNVLPYAAGPGYQAISLPYVGDDISMLVLVPDAGTFESFESGLSAEGLDEIIAALEPRTATLVFPKFQFESEFGLADTLRTLGMADAFDDTVADFSAMDGTNELFIGGVYHKAFVAVDEKGTEAAAATAVVMQVESVSMPDLHLIVDRPFIFLIRDNTSGAILFLGRVVNPVE